MLIVKINIAIEVIIPPIATTTTALKPLRSKANPVIILYDLEHDSEVVVIH